MCVCMYMIIILGMRVCMCVRVCALPFAYRNRTPQQFDSHVASFPEWCGRLNEPLPAKRARRRSVQASGGIWFRLETCLK